MEYDDFTTKQKLRISEYDDSTAKQNPRISEYDDFTTTQNPRKSEYDDFTTTQNPRISEYDDFTTTQNPRKSEYEKNSTADIFKPTPTKKSNIENLSRRWAKKQPTKCELMDSVLDIKASLIVTSNNVSTIDRRLQVLETNVSELIAYINTKL
jgi:hypothetical protein